MPNDAEQVVYEYTGDVSSLRKATEQAIGFLDSYQKHIDRISADGGFGKNTKAAKSFQSAIKASTKDIAAMQKKMQGITDVKLFSGTDVQKQITNSLGGLSQVQAKLQASTGLTTKEVQALTNQLKSSRQSLQASGSDVEALIAKEAKFQQTLETTRAKVGHFRDSLDSIKTRVSSVFDPLVARLNTLRNPFAKVVQTVQTFKAKASDSLGRVAQLASTVSSAFRRVSTSEDAAGNAATRATKAHTSLTGVLNKMRSLFSRETKAIKDEDDTLSKKNKTLNSSTRSHRSLGLVLLNLIGVFSRESRSIINMNTQLGNLTRKSGLAKNALLGLSGVQLGRWLQQAVDQSINYTENLNLFTVATGDAYDESIKFVSAMAELYGMDPSNLMRYAGNFYQLADAISMPSKASAILSLSLTKATNDIASLFNIGVETVFNDLSSGMQGMSRAVRKYGMDIRTTTLQQTALSLGITEQVENMSEANRQGLRFITMMQQANNASGDFARTIESPANQLRIFKEQITQLGRAIGNFFIGPLSTAISYLNGFIMALRTILQFIGSIVGVVNNFFGGKSSDSAEQTLENVTSGVSGIGGAAKDTTKELKKMLAPFDELTLLQAPEPETGGGGGGGGGGLSDVGTLDPAILKAIEDMQWKLDDVEMKAVKVRNAILAFLGFTVEDGTILSWDAGILEQNLINKFPQWTKTIQATFDNWSSIVNGFKAVFKSMATIVQSSWQKVMKFIKKFVNDDSVSKHISNLGTTLEENADSIAKFVLAFGALKTLAPLVTTVGSLITSLSGFSSFLPGLSAALAGVTAPMALWASLIAVVGVALADLWMTNEDFRDNVGAAWDSLVKVLSDLWTVILQPILKSIIDTALSIYQDTIKPVVEQIANVILTLWSDILQPVLSWLIDILGPIIVEVANLIIGVLEWIFNNVGGVIRGILQFLQGIIDFIAGVFSGDWSRAWSGIVSIFSGVFNAIGSVVVAIMNGVISVINTAITTVYGAVVAVINLVLGVINSIAGALGFTVDLGIDANIPQIPYIPAPTVALAEGGVVQSPTTALIGEGRYDEAVVPLGNSPQMRQFADSVADRVNNGEQVRLLRDQNELLRQILAKTGTYLDGRLISDTVTKYQKQRSKAMGG